LKDLRRERQTKLATRTNRWGPISEQSARSKTAVACESCTRQPDRYGDRVVRLFSLRNGRRADFQQAVLSDLRSDGGYAARVRNLRARLCGETSGRFGIRPLRRQDWA